MKKLFTLMMLLFCTILIAQDKIYVHTATADNSAFDLTVIDHPDLNNNPDAGIVIAHTWNGNGLPGVYNNNVTGLYYNGTNWGIFNESSENIVEGSKYNVYIADDPLNVITHIATLENQGSTDFYTVLDDDRINSSNPGPYLILSTYYNPNGIRNDFNYGSWYNTTEERRNLYTENFDAIPEGTAFKVLINGEGVTRFTQTATVENIVSNWTVIDNASLNGNPNATFVFSHYWGVNGADSEVSLDAVFGVWYDGANWAIYCEDPALEIPVGMAFDVIVAPQTTTGINEVALEAEVSVSPNPTTNFVTISTKESISNVTLYNNTGREILFLVGQGNSLEIDLSDYSQGIYMAKVRVGDAEKTIKLIKQ